ncbi:MAG TPA: aminoglycoside phosphotransferase family protein [Acidimicrobiales bacterium]|nr:aminoglycoside phosphotransferase family protein [Acidimicrobiales bacterium]
MIDEGAVGAAVAGALIDAVPVTGVERILQGFSSESFVVGTAVGPVVAKVGLPWSDLDKWRAAAVGLELARARGVPAPEPLAFLDSVPELEGRILRIYRFIEGVTPRPESSSTAFFVQLGAALRRLHSIALPQFTARVGRQGFDRWSDFLAHRWDAIVERCEVAGVDAALIAAARAEATRLALDVDDVVRPVLCHRDLYLDNVLVDDDGALVALLDFDIVEAWDPVVDFFKAEWFIFEPNPAARDPFLAGYLADGAMPPMFDDRLRLVSIVELINHAANWHIQGQVEIVDVALARLSVLLED